MIGIRPDFFDSEYFVMERNNFHVKKDAPKDIVDKMLDYRKKHYHDNFVYGNPAIHSETKDGIHTDE